VWSKVARFMEVLHIVGDILTKVSVNSVLIYMLHYYLCVFLVCGLYLCLYLWVFLDYV
jgi:hypothetical protein